MLAPGEQLPVPELTNALSKHALTRFEHELMRATVLFARNTMDETRMNLHQENVTHSMTIPETILHSGFTGEDLTFGGATVETWLPLGKQSLKDTLRAIPISMVWDHTTSTFTIGLASEIRLPMQSEYYASVAALGKRLMTIKGTMRAEAAVVGSISITVPELEAVDGYGLEVAPEISKVILDINPVPGSLVVDTNYDLIDAGVRTFVPTIESYVEAELNGRLPEVTAEVRAYLGTTASAQH
jgi:hypothetical protein